MLDRIEVKVVACRGLVLESREACNPCVRVSCAGDPATYTKALAHTQDPEWRDGHLMVFANLYRRGIDYLVAEVLHKNMASGELELVGSAHLSLTSALLSAGSTVDEWCVRSSVLQALALPSHELSYRACTRISQGAAAPAEPALRARAPRCLRRVARSHDLLCAREAPTSKTSPLSSLSLSSSLFSSRRVS